MKTLARILFFIIFGPILLGCVLLLVNANNPKEALSALAGVVCIGFGMVMIMSDD